MDTPCCVGADFHLVDGSSSSYIIPIGAAAAAVFGRKTTRLVSGSAYFAAGPVASSPLARPPDPCSLDTRIDSGRGIASREGRSLARTAGP